MNILKIIFLLIAAGFLLNSCASQKESGQNVLAPIFVDPNYRGSCDPEIIWNENDQLWYIYYTARRPMLENTWLSTPLGVIASKDLLNWEFKGYCKFDGVGGVKDATSTYWAPAIISENDTLHMFVTWKPDTIPTQGAWGGQGWIVHYKTPLNNPVEGWQKVTALHDSTLNTLDATVYKNQNLFHVWFKGKEINAKKNELYHLATTDFQKWDKLGFSKSDVLSDNEARFWSNYRPAEELYDLNEDPHEMHNLAHSLVHHKQLIKLRAQLENWVVETDDKGQYPEDEANLRYTYERWGDAKCINPEYDRFRPKK